MKFLAIGENHLYTKAYQNGKRAVSNTVVVYVLRDKHAGFLKKENPNKEYVNRIGISASKKIGGAVQRNRAKRVIREAYREIDKAQHVNTGFLIVLSARTAATEAKMQDVKRDMQYCLEKLDMIKEKDGSDDTVHS